ncbi:hypothetical protein Mag101_02590 [Microbulbifer agarilyticus]|uniref:Glycosyltransferase n=2 Tax=Microbulbifer agarilyticus TaxID=260552 RepID=A0A1Q2M1Y6_9GAMM|nr:hypothetical protein Mag101_02590 [Microbulbifer agarilyticus]
MSSEFGGLEKHVMELAAWQAANKCASIAIIAHPRYRQHCPESVRFFPLDTDRSRRNPFLLIEIVRICRKMRFDLLHGHGGKAACVMATVRSLMPIMHVITRHNVVHPKDRVAAHFSRRIAVSEKAIAESSLHWEVIPNGTAAPRQRLSCPSGYDAGSRAVLAVARLVPAKGIDLLLEAWANVKPRNALLYLVGDGPDRRKLEDLTQSFCLDGSVRFVGYSNEVDAWMQVAEFMVVSSFKEGAPYTVVEALLNRCPVISTDVGSNREVLPSEYIAQDVTAASIAMILTKALESPAGLRQVFEPVFQYAERHLTVNAMARATWAVYEAP